MNIVLLLCLRSILFQLFLKSVFLSAGFQPVSSAQQPGPYSGQPHPSPQPQVSQQPQVQHPQPGYPQQAGAGAPTSQPGYGQPGTSQYAGYAQPGAPAGVQAAAPSPRFGSPAPPSQQTPYPPPVSDLTW